MASWCCPHVSSGAVQPSSYVLTSYGRMAARCPTAARVPPCTSRAGGLPKRKWFRRARGPLAHGPVRDTSPKSWGVFRPDSQVDE